MRREKVWYVLFYVLGYFVLVYVLRSVELYYEGNTELLRKAQTGTRDPPVVKSPFTTVKEDTGLHDDIGTVTEQTTGIYTTTRDIFTTTSPSTQMVTYEHEDESEENRIMKFWMFYNYSPKVRNYSFETCEYSACALTLDSAKADLLVFDGAEMAGVTLPKTRPPGQIWLIRTREAPTARRFPSLRRSDLMSQFNWSKTIFNDSTFQIRYGLLDKRPEMLKKNYDAIYAQKKYDVAWYVSHCNTSSQREIYVRRMSPHVTIHIYGTCGDRNCGAKGAKRYGFNADCFELLSRDYKFYLSFENSLCRDYVTEKFFNMFNNVDVIPVVRGGADYDRLFPSGTFINSGDFRSPEDLGKYLKTLSHDKKRYIAMLERKNRYMPTSFPNSNCAICKALHLRQPANVYAGDFLNWFNRSENCWSPKDL